MGRHVGVNQPVRGHKIEVVHPLKRPIQRRIGRQQNATQKKRASM
jgi:hypothetical protein